MFIEMKITSRGSNGFETFECEKGKAYCLRDSIGCHFVNRSYARPLKRHEIAQGIVAGTILRPEGTEDSMYREAAEAIANDYLQPFTPLQYREVLEREIYDNLCNGKPQTFNLLAAVKGIVSEHTENLRPVITNPASYAAMGEAL